MYRFNKKVKILIIATVIVLFSVVSYYIYASSEEGEILSYNEALTSEAGRSEQKDEQNENNANFQKNTDGNKNSNVISNKNLINNCIVVHVAGCVTNPGVVQLQENSRISDAIEKAGGVTNEGDISKINLAFILEDGMKVYIPSHNEVEEEKKMEKESQNLSQNVITKNSNYDESSKINEKSGSGASSNSNLDKTKDLKVNLNTATQSELEILPGIGEATALKIINYRNENGKFKTIDDVKNVKGIGDSKFENIKELICVK